MPWRHVVSSGVGFAGAGDLQAVTNIFI